MKVRDTLSSTMTQYIPPLKEGETATFRLTNAGKVDRNREDLRTREKQRTAPFRYILAGRENVYDTETGTRKLIRNVTSMEYEIMPDKSEKPVPKDEPIVFVNGEVTVTASQQDAYMFLMASEKRKGNPFSHYATPGKKKNLFYLVGDIAIKKEEEIIADIRDEAIIWLREAREDELKATIMKLPDNIKSKLSLDNDLDVIRRALRKMIDDPAVAKLVMMSTPGIEKVVYQLKEAEKWMIIKFDEKTRRWSYTADPPEGLEKEICAVDAGIDRYKGFVEWIGANQKDDKGAGYDNYKYIVERTRKFYQR